MDELIKQGQWWWPFVVPVATGILALLGSWFGTKLGKTTEHGQWLRNKKQEAYYEFLSVAESIVAELSQWPVTKPPQHSISELRSKRGLVKIVGTPKVRHAAMATEVGIWLCTRIQDIILGGDPEKNSERWNAYREQVADLNGDLLKLVIAVREDLGTVTSEDKNLNAENLEGVEFLKKRNEHLHIPAEFP